MDKIFTAYQKLLELHETDPELCKKLEAHYRITSEVKAQFKKDTGKDWK
jgi:hypothetical protein